MKMKVQWKHFLRINARRHVLLMRQKAGRQLRKWPTSLVVEQFKYSNRFLIYRHDMRSKFGLNQVHRQCWNKFQKAGKQVTTVEKVTYNKIFSGFWWVNCRHLFLFKNTFVHNLSWIVVEETHGLSQGNSCTKREQCLSLWRVRNYQLIFSKSLTFHPVQTKKVMTVSVFGYLIVYISTDFYAFISPFSP